MSQNGSGKQPQDGKNAEGNLGPRREELDALAERLRLKEEELRQLEQELKSNESSGRGLLSTKPLTMDKGNYEFRVGPRDKAKWGDKLPDEFVTTVDESEAIRWYVATHQDPNPNRKNKQVDPVQIPIVAECVNNQKRKDLILKMNRLAFIRRKAENGTLTPDEQEMLMQADYAAIN